MYTYICTCIYIYIYIYRAEAAVLGWLLDRKEVIAALELAQTQTEEEAMCVCVCIYIYIERERDFIRLHVQCVYIYIYMYDYVYTYMRPSPPWCRRSRPGSVRTKLCPHSPRPYDVVFVQLSSGVGLMAVHLTSCSKPWPTGGRLDKVAPL